MLREGGYLLTTTPNLDALNAIPREERNRIWEIQPVELPVNRARLNELLESAGFRVVSDYSRAKIQQTNRIIAHRTRKPKR
jgi:hypothetical protein